MTTYYTILGIDPTATADQIKKAYRSAAMKHHPDRGGDVQEFQRIQEAYDTLSDPNKRASYDNPPYQQHHQHHGGFNFNMNDMFSQFSAAGVDLSSIFGGQFHNRAPVNHPIQLQVTLSLLDAFNGKEMVANLRHPSGTEQNVTLNVPKGIHSGTTVKFTGMGISDNSGAPPGDILLTVHVNDDPKYARQGDDLLVDVPVNCLDAIAGGFVLVDGIDGSQFNATIVAGTQHGTIYKIAGHGMPNINTPSHRGDLLMRVSLVVPALSNADIAHIQKIRAQL